MSIDFSYWSLLYVYFIYIISNFGLTSLSIYDDLFKEDVYWLGNFVPDTSINIENLLRNKGETNFSREVVKELSGDYVLFKFSKNIS